MTKVNLGFDPHHTIRFRVEMSVVAYPEEQALLLFRRLFPLLSAIPGSQAQPQPGGRPVCNPSTRSANTSALPGNANLPTGVGTLSGSVVQAANFPYRFPNVAPGQSSVRNGEAGNPSLLYKFPSGLSAQS